jgi:hypothetical protein
MAWSQTAGSANTLQLRPLVDLHYRFGRSRLIETRRGKKNEVKRRRKEIEREIIGAVSLKITGRNTSGAESTYGDGLVAKPRIVTGTPSQMRSLPNYCRSG